MEVLLKLHEDLKKMVVRTHAIVLKHVVILPVGTELELEFLKLMYSLLYLDQK